VAGAQIGDQHLRYAGIVRQQVDLEARPHRTVAEFVTPGAGCGGMTF
jgi:hypothetical protein